MDIANTVCTTMLTATWVPFRALCADRT